MIDLLEVITDPELCEPYLIQRSTGKFVAGGWQDSKTEIQAFGVVSNVSPQELEMVPEGDRVSAMRGFHWRDKLYRTHAKTAGREAGTSDVIVYKDSSYRIVAVFPYGNHGYWKALAARTAGD